jgi:hypothetical protein
MGTASSDSSSAPASPALLAPTMGGARMFYFILFLSVGKATCGVLSSEGLERILFLQGQFYRWR